MTQDTPSIHDFDFSLICEYFAALERQGPGSPEVTLKALSFIDGLTLDSRIADIGCGTGAASAWADYRAGSVSLFYPQVQRQGSG